MTAAAIRSGAIGECREHPRERPSLAGVGVDLPSAHRERRADRCAHTSVPDALAKSHRAYRPARCSTR